MRVKVKFDRFAEFEKIPGFVYCGRRWAGYPQSPLGNPFRPRKGDHQTPIQRYRDWLKAKVAAGDQQVMEAMAKLTADSVLGCWCCDKEEAGLPPLVCHCDIIALVWESRFGRPAQLCERLRKTAAWDHALSMEASAHLEHVLDRDSDEWKLLKIALDGYERRYAPRG